MPKHARTQPPRVRGGTASTASGRPAGRKHAQALPALKKAVKRYFAGQLVWVKWRRVYYVAYILGPNDDEGKTYDVQYVGEFKGPMLEVNVKAERITSVHESKTFLLDTADTDNFTTNKLVGETISVLWDGDACPTKDELNMDDHWNYQYHQAKVLKFHPEKRRHTLYYPDDEHEDPDADLNTLVALRPVVPGDFPVSAEVYNAKRSAGSVATVKRRKKKRKTRKSPAAGKVAKQLIMTPSSDDSALHDESLDATPMTAEEKRTLSYAMDATFPPGTMVWHEPTGKKDPWWPGIILSPTSVESSEDVFDWFVYDTLPRAPNALLVYYFGTKNFGASKQGSRGLKQWADHSPQRDDGEKFIAMNASMRSKFHRSIQEATALVDLPPADRVAFLGFQDGPSLSLTRGKNHADDTSTRCMPKDDLAAMRCQICSSLYDEDMMIICDNCNKGFHIYCCCAKVPDTVLQDEWYCQFCRATVDVLAQEDGVSEDGLGQSSAVSMDGADNNVAKDDLVDVRCCNDTFDELEFFSVKMKCWVRQSLVSPKAIQVFYNSKHMLRSVSRSSMRGIPVVSCDAQVARRDASGAVVLTYTVRRYKFLNGTYVGITQIVDYFTPGEILGMERSANSVINSIVPPPVPAINLLHHDGKMEPATLNGNDDGEQTPVCLERAMTVDRNDHRKRVKVFLGYRYAYGASKTMSRLFNDVDPVDSIPFVNQLRNTIANDIRLVPSDFINQAVMNYYMDRNSCLGIHQDEKKLFLRPIVSIRLFSPSVLSFGCKGMGMQETSSYIPIQQGVGTITVMEGLAANNMVHCIRAKDIAAKSLSIIFRRVTDEAVTEMQKLNHIDALEKAAAATAAAHHPESLTPTMAQTMLPPDTHCLERQDEGSLQ